MHKNTTHKLSSLFGAIVVFVAISANNACANGAEKSLAYKKVPPKLAEQVFDSGVQHGINDSGQWLQKSLDETLGTDLRVPDEKGNLFYDGIIGTDTRGAVARAVKEGKIKDINNLFADKRFSYMKALSNFGDNRGWRARVDSFRMQ